MVGGGFRCLRPSQYSPTGDGSLLKRPQPPAKCIAMYPWQLTPQTPASPRAPASESVWSLDHRCRRPIYGNTVCISITS